LEGVGVEVAKAKKRGFMRFQTKEGRPPLSREDFLYWMDFLPKVLKIGTEFEINLPSMEEALQHKEEKACVHSGHGCYVDCANLETCLVDRHPAFCATRSNGSFLGEHFECPAKSDRDVEACQSCPAWALNCRGSSCAMYVPICATCPSFSRNGKTVEKIDIRQDPDAIRKEMTTLLQPTGFVGKVGKTAVLEVKKDNSLSGGGGIEVPTVGRRVHWNSFYQMCKNIIDPIVARGGFVNERCGQHYHILAGYFNGQIGRAMSELEQDLPEVVLANFHQLNRRYELAMFWLMSSGDNRLHMTRWAKFRQSIFKYGAMKNRMLRVQEDLAQHIQCMNNNQRGKYASVAYHFCEFGDEGNIRTFHVENRIADGVLSPAVATAWAMLIYAMVLKAVRVSQYGIMEVGDREYVAKVREIQPCLIDGEHREWGENRRADTTNLSPHLPWLRENAKELVGFLKPELSNLGPAYDILLSLADRPCSVRLIEGDTWEKIEQDLIGTHLPNDQSFEDEVRQLVDLAGIVDCANIDVWAEEVAASIGEDPIKVAEVVQRMVGSGNYRWSSPVGALITT
jgi:hypothetical protein